MSKTVTKKILLKKIQTKSSIDSHFMLLALICLKFNKIMTSILSDMPKVLIVLTVSKV